jgi:GDP-L-fucose synthase
MTEPIYSLSGKRVWVTGHNGLVGSAIVRRLQSENCEIITADRRELDLTRQQPVEAWMANQRPQVVFLAAGRVGGIHANNSHPAGFLYENAALLANIVEASRQAEVEKLILLGSSCIYPRHAPQPIPEDALLTGPLEPTNEAYAIAKIMGMKMAQAYRREYGCDFICAMPTNLYGPNDNFDLENSHVLPALLRKAHEAKLANMPEMVVWGTGTPRREFLHVDDCADALVFLALHYSGEQHINVGAGEDISILELTRMVADIVGYRGGIRSDLSKPDGMPQKLLRVDKLTAMGWKARIPLREGLASTYSWFEKNFPPK